MTLDRISALDGLRALAIGTVVAVHALPLWFPGGFLGVDLFFVISGYLVTRILASEWDQKGTIRLAAFARRRFFRIWPAFSTLLLLVAVISLQPGLGEHGWTVLVAAMSMTNLVSAVLGSDYGGLLRHTWSLSAEEQFYILWPMGLVLGRWLDHRNALVCGLSLAITLCTAWRVYLFLHGADGPRLYNGLDTHCEGLLLGCALALCPPNRWSKIARSTWIVPLGTLAGILAFVAPDGSFNLTVGLLLVPVCAAWLLQATVDGAPGLKFLSSSPLVWLGRRSYSLYLWHWPVFQIVSRLPLEAPISIPLEIAIALGLAELSYRLIEQPMLRFKAPRKPAELVLHGNAEAESS